MWAVAAPHGEWVLAIGPARGRGDYYPALLLDSGSDRFVRLGAAPPWGPAAGFSGDGRRAAWMHVRSLANPSAEIVVVDLAAPAAEARTTRIGFPSPPSGLVLSEDGARLAVLHRDVLSVFETDSGALLASAKLPATSTRHTLIFAAPDRVRVAQSAEGQHVDLFELDVAARKLVKAGGADVEPGRYFWNRERDRLLVEPFFRAKRTLLLDGRTGEPIATLRATEAPRRRHARFLYDGRIVVAENDDAGGRLRLYDRDGVELQVLELGRRPILQLGAEAVAGKLAATAGRGAGNDDQRATVDSDVLLVDLATGTSETIGTGMTPLAATTPWANAADFGPPEPGSAATRLFQDERGALLAYQPAGGGWRLVAGRSR